MTYQQVSKQKEKCLKASIQKVGSTISYQEFDE